MAKQPCAECPFREDVSFGSFSTSYIPDVASLEPGGVVQPCHMIEQQTGCDSPCVGQQQFREGGHQGIIASAEEFLARRQQKDDGK
jgi:hypothetical protein